LALKALYIEGEISSRPTQTTGWAPPAGLTNTSSSSNVYHPGTNQAQPCLASVGNQSWASGDMAAYIHGFIFIIPAQVNKLLWGPVGDIKTVKICYVITFVHLD